MHDVLRSKIQSPSQKFHNNSINFEKRQNFKKNPKKLGQMHEKEGLGPLPSEEQLHIGWKVVEDEVWSEREREVLGGEKSRGIKQNEFQIALNKYIKAQ